MTTLRNSQLGAVSVSAPPNAVGFRNSQLGAIAVSSNPAAAGLRISQLAVIAVVANNTMFKSMGPVIGLGCWTPCGTLLFNGE